MTPMYPTLAKGLYREMKDSKRRLSLKSDKSLIVNPYIPLTLH